MPDLVVSEGMQYYIDNVDSSTVQCFGKSLDLSIMTAIIPRHICLALGVIGVHFEIFLKSRTKVAQ